MDASDYRIAGDAHRTAGGRSNHNQYLIENPISPEAVLEKEKELILAFIPPVRRKTWKSRITRHRLDRTVLQYPSILKASILVLCSYPLSTPSPSFSSINPPASLHSSLCFGSSPLHRSLSLPLLVCFFWELRLRAVPSIGFSRRWDPIPSFTSQQSMQVDLCECPSHPFSRRSISVCQHPIDLLLSVAACCSVFWIHLRAEQNMDCRSRRWKHGKCSLR